MYPLETRFVLGTYERIPYIREIKLIITIIIIIIMPNLTLRNVQTAANKDNKLRLFSPLIQKPVIMI